MDVAAMVAAGFRAYQICTALAFDAGIRCYNRMLLLQQGLSRDPMSVATSLARGRAARVPKHVLRAYGQPSLMVWLPPFNRSLAPEGGHRDNLLPPAGLAPRDSGLEPAQPRQVARPHTSSGSGDLPSRNLRCLNRRRRGRFRRRRADRRRSVADSARPFCQTIRRIG